MTRLIIASFLLTLSACAPNYNTDPQSLIDNSIKSHGLDQLKDKSISFKFRKKLYSVSRNNNEYIYTRTFPDSTGVVKDILVNSSHLTREVNGVPSQITKKQEDIAIEAVNSVLYFFQLPFGLNDAAVNKKYVGTDIVNGKDYHLISVTFAQDGGGADFQDNYLYWINQKDNTIDFLAYNYIVNGGGVRFREAINRRAIDGLIFQDYVNYKPDSKSTPLKDLSKLYSEGKLKELSRIISEEVEVRGI